jgi:hypothetical protein
VAHNALHQLRDDQDGIEACRQRNTSLPNVRSVARRILGVQSEANERRYPPLPPLACSPSCCF